MLSDPRKPIRTSTPGVFKLGNRYVVRFRDPQGRSRKRFAKTLAEARVLKASVSADMARGEYRDRSSIRFDEYARAWIETYRGRTARGVREATRADYRRILEADAIPFFGRRRLMEIDPPLLKRYAAAVESRGVSRNTVRLALAPVRILLATAHEDGLIRSNPAEGVRITAGTEREEPVRALTEEELRLLLAEIPGEWQPFFSLLATTGLRIGEAVALRFRDLDLGRRRVLVRRRLYRGEFAAPKSRYGRREVPVPASVARALWAIRKARAGAGDEDLVFAAANGSPIDPSNLMSRVLKPAARRTGVPWAGFHSLRHTCATILFRRGWNAVQVQLALGHHSPAFTLATYVHLLPADVPGSPLDDVALLPAGDGQRLEGEAVADAV
ncbi:MAG: site-specific integrase [Chloroflexota bacterium]|nr:site-specific integrase [Chloroflexota bacterium]